MSNTNATLAARFEAFAHRQWLKRSVLARLLWPLGVITGWVAWRRHAQLHKAYRPRFKVIVIGSLYVGGTGKTPVVAALAQALAQRFYEPFDQPIHQNQVRVAVLSHRYNARSDDGQLPYVFHTGIELTDKSANDGDEAALMAQLLQGCGVAVVAGRDRVAGVKLIENQFPHVQFVICDDGLQHYKLARDVEIAVFDARGLGNGWCLPAGPLREQPRRLRDCDAIVLRDDVAPLKTLHSADNGIDIGAVPQLALRTQLSDAVHLMSGKRHALTSFCAQTKILAAAGIGLPERFFEALRQAGLTVSTQVFNDHAVFASNPFADSDANIILVTSKDAIKLKAVADARVYYVPITVNIPAQLLTLIEAKTAAMTAANAAANAAS